MLTSKERAALRAQANTLETTLTVGKGGVTEQVIAEAEGQLTAREASDQICQATGADGVAALGSRFVIYRFSEKCQAQRNQVGRAKRKETPVSKSDPVRKGVRARRQAAKRQREERNAFFREKAVQAAIEKRKGPKSEE